MRRRVLASADRLPPIVHTVRFRLTVLYSTLLFALAALVIGGIYVGLSRNVSGTPVTKSFTAIQGVYRNGEFKPLRSIEVAAVEDIERAANAQTLQTLRSYSGWSLGGLFAGSLVIGWVLSGRALRPVRRITTSAGAIDAGDLSQRIRLSGPDDEFHRLADSLDSMLARLDDAFTAQRRLFDDASHELRNPLAIIQTTTDAVLLSDDATPTEHREASLVVSRASRRMTRLVEDLLATARQSAPAFTDDGIDLADVIGEAGAEYETFAVQGSLSLVYRVDLRADLVVLGDHDSLRRAIANLLSNAVRYTPAGGTVTLGAGAAGDWRWMAVHDTGPGIPDSVQRQVFDRFYRGDGTAESAGHTGLGLSIVRQIAEGHRGSVAVHSPAGHGTTFVLWLPAAGAATDEQTAPAGDPLAS
jgi:signal transduction histidine kinase